MRELIISLVQAFQTEYNGKTVGAGGDFGATLTNGPFTITTYFHQWQQIDNPSMHIQIVQEDAEGGNFECCGGITTLKVNVRISVDQKLQGWSIASILYEEFRKWLCAKNYSLAPAGEDYLVVVDASRITANHIYEGDVFSIHTMIYLTYLRGYIA